MQTTSQNHLKRRYDEAAGRAASLARREYPRIAGILVHGSVARREPGPFSDIDMVVVTNRRRKPSEFSYFDGDIYVGVGFLSVAELEQEFTDPKAFFWARGSAKATRILYDPREFCKESFSAGRGPSPQIRFWKNLSGTTITTSSNTQASSGTVGLSEMNI